VAQRAVQVGEDRALGEEEAAVGLPDDARRRIEARVGRIPAAELLGGEDLVRDLVELGRLERAAEGRPVLGPALDRAGGDEEPLVRIGLEVVPELVRSTQQRHVGGVLVVRQADDARQPVG
jgi:hypothetical protein